MSDVIKKGKFSHGDTGDAEARIQSLSRSLDVLAEINKAILRQKNIPDLYLTACRIAVEKGDFERAYISLIDPITGQIDLVAHANISPSYLETLKRVGATSPISSPFRKLLEAGNYVYSNDIDVDPAMQKWRADVKQSGCRSWASLPLIVEGDLRGLFTLFAREPDYFGEEELRLVQEMATDISYAMAYAEQAAQLARHTAELEQSVVDLNHAQTIIAESHARFRSIVDDQVDLICRYDTNLNLTFVNAAYSNNHASTPDTLIGSNILDLIPAEDRARARMHVSTLTAENPVAISEHQTIMPDGTRRWFQWTDRALTDDTGHIIEYQGVGRDISERRRMEEVERQQRHISEALHESLEALISSLDVETVMYKILEQAARVFQYDAATIAQFEGGQVKIRYNRGVSSDTLAVLTDFLNGLPSNDYHERIRAGQHYLVSDTRSETRWTILPMLSWIRSSLGVPIVIRGEVIGVLSLDSQHIGHYSEADIEPMKTFAGYAGLALENAYHAASLEQKVIDRTAELTREKERIEVILNNSVDGILLTSVDMTIKQGNRAFNHLFGCLPADYIGKSLVDLAIPEHATVVEKLVDACVTEKSAKTTEIVAQRNDGVQFDAALSISYTGTGDSDHHGIVCTIHDLSPLKERERELRFHASLQENVTDAVIATTLDFRIQSWNRAAETMFGWHASEVIDKHFGDVLPADVEMLQQMRNEFRKRGSWSGEIMHQHRDGRWIYVQVSLVVFRDEYGQPLGIVSVNHDITARVQAEQALRQALAKETELGELKSRFVSIASHEFRTPLASILATTETLSAYRQNMAEDQVEQRLMKIREQVNHLTDIMDDVLHLARIQARRVQFNPVELDIDALCRDILDEFQIQRDFQHQLLYVCQPNLPKPKLDKKLMRQIITNLISNAIKYSPVTKPIRIALNYETEMLKLAVKDEGIGVPEADQKHLFEPFHRGQNVGTIAGTGLGLAIIWESVSLHGGRIDMQSKVGQGSVFTVMIPAPALQEE